MIFRLFQSMMFWKTIFSKEKFWYIIYENGSIDGGLMSFDHIRWVANEREKNGRKNFQIVFQKRTRLKQLT